MEAETAQVVCHLEKPDGACLLHACRPKDLGLFEGAPWPNTFSSPRTETYDSIWRVTWCSSLLEFVRDLVVKAQ